MVTVAYRPLTSEERNVIVWLLEHSGPAAKDFLPQLEVVQARPSCTCGCPSIEFSVPVDAPFVDATDCIPELFTGQSGEYAVGLMLIAGSGVLSELGVFTFGGNEHPFALPKIETLQVAVLESQHEPHLNSDSG